MFKWYGVVGLLMMLFVHVNYVLGIQPFARWYFLIVWVGYILLVDAIIYQLHHSSLLTKRPKTLVGIAITSVAIWWLFELVNLRVANWGYHGEVGIAAVGSVAYKTVMFATMLPSFFETVELFRTLHLFDDKKLRHKHKITKKGLHAMMLGGLLCLILPLVWPSVFFPLVWLTFFLLLDPINFLNKEPSIIQHWRDRRLAIPLVLVCTGLTLGFLWEFWNYWAPPATKWFYNIPYLGFFKIFEMPILGYFGYIFFAFELYAMYFFFRSLFKHREKLLT
ncbi:MAG: hypothetical protein QF486_06910 [Candidatus Woesearchaeota archaeon]|jgi:hypothetical protein|nr:hypothetical protein [Candidatus Woesearchaeota archaeon]MDP7182178.1 hypothetical protein [Candidatus Woesearchaeota archaeon]MDP7199315.1 hypothetical protein [Candidatus Woesearchaeota archaeon]MDP7467950.1 hypothetical protein [Candidatus Woesearchaeota archaeon]MDP7647574.1 hypothetical protein [Candidatus Woesearchaeota archaeon]